MALLETANLRSHLASAAAPQFLWEPTRGVCISDLAYGTCFGDRLTDLEGRSILLATESQLATALALIELDGHVRRLVILPSDTEVNHLGALMANAEIDMVVTDRKLSKKAPFLGASCIECEPSVQPRSRSVSSQRRTEWVLLTSGTVGLPKLVVHDLSGLMAAMEFASPADRARAWGTFYDIRRYGGLQIFLRAVCGGTSLVLSNAGEAVADHLARLAHRGVTHISGTPSHWRRALMNPAIDQVAPTYVRLSGEIADQAVLDSLRKKFPSATLAHAYASTEAGVVFEVNDCLAGFPVAYTNCCCNGVEIKVADGTLRVRSFGAARGYLGPEQLFRDEDGFVDTGDIVEQRGERYYFVGRRGGIINVGGNKIHPEEIEVVINCHPQVHLSLVRSAPSPLLGSIVVADVVLKQQHTTQEEKIREGILELCRRMLPRHKVPAKITFVSSVPVSSSGKLTRR